MEQSNIAAGAFVRLTLRFPFWTEVAYSMTIKEATAEEVEAGLKTQATDGRTLWINADFFKSIPLDQQVSELVHELGHKIFLHCTRMGARDAKLWNYACDYVINAMMKSNGFTIPSDWLLDMQYDGWLAEAVYADLLKKQKDQPKDGSSGGGKGQPQLAPGRHDIRQQTGTPEQVSKHEDEVKALVERAIANAKAMGSLPAGIEQGTVAVFKPAREPWYNHLHRFMQSLSSSEYNWARLNRRTLRSHGVFTPLHLSESLGDVALFIDTSGSCYAAAQQANFAAHLNAILAEAKPHRVHTYYFDTRVYPGEVIEAGEFDVKIKPRGGGGTSFAHLFEQLTEDGVEPAVSIVLTDLMGTFGEEPDHPVVWANVLEHGEAPFGETIHVAD